MAVGDGCLLRVRRELVQAFRFKAILAFTRFPNVLSKGVTGRHFRKSNFTYNASLSVHGKTFNCI